MPRAHRRTPAVALVPVAVLLALALLAPGAALAQSGGAFDELTASPTPTSTPDGGGGFSLSGNATLYVIAGALLVAFGVVTWWISRDARSTVREHSAAEAHAGRRDAATDPELRKAAGKAAHARKSQARKKGRAQKAARRRNR